MDGTEVTPVADIKFVQIGLRAAQLLYTVVQHGGQAHMIFGTIEVTFAEES